MNSADLKNIFSSLEQAFKYLNIDYYLIGAVARQYWFETEGISHRNTKDVDYAILVGSDEEYQKVRRYLIENEGYTASKNNAFVLISSSKVPVDLLPFGKIEKDGNVTVEGAGLTDINMAGMKEIYYAGTEKTEMYFGSEFKVATLPAIVLLKLIAFDDRPEHRQKDSIDIGNIILNFFAICNNLIYEMHNDLFDGDRTLENIGSIVIGREIGKILEGNVNLKDRIEEILKKNITLSGNNAFIRIMVAGIGIPIERAVEYLNDMLWGLNNSPIERR